MTVLYLVMPIFKNKKMALNPTALATSIKNAMLANISSPTAQQTQEINTLATSIAQGINTFVLGLTITYTTGLTAPTGAVGGAFGNTLT